MKIESRVGALAWSSYDGPTLAGISRLYTRKGETLLLLDFRCYVTPLPDARILVWCARSGRNYGETVNPIVHFEVIDPSSLRPIGDAASEAARMRQARHHRFFAGRSVAEYAFAAARPPGKYNLPEVPSAFTQLDETLVLADYLRDDQTSDTVAESIYVFDFHHSQVEVIPQDWFNNGDYDFGYQWITRVARDPRTDRILGEGIRLRSFRLDASGRNVEEWLAHSPFQPATA